VPCPPVAAPQADHVMSVTVMAPVAHPTVSFVGRTLDVDPGPQDRTPGTDATFVVVVRGEVVVDTDAELFEPPLVVDAVGCGEDLEPTASPMAVPAPRATRTSATTPIRTTVLRRTVITLGSLLTTKGNGSSMRWRSDKSRGVRASGGRPSVHGELDSAAMGRAHTRYSIDLHDGPGACVEYQRSRDPWDAQSASHLCAKSCIAG
jgi:hypothetical protein